MTNIRPGFSTRYHSHAYEISISSGSSIAKVVARRLVERESRKKMSADFLVEMRSISPAIVVSIASTRRASPGTKDHVLSWKGIIDAMRVRYCSCSAILKILKSVTSERTLALSLAETTHHPLDIGARSCEIIATQENLLLSVDIFLWKIFNIEIIAYKLFIK